MMILAKVIGHVVATQKSDALKGSNLLLVSAIDTNKEIILDKTYVAIDCVGAGKGDTVLVEKYFPIYQDKYKAMSIVAIVEKVHWDINSYE